ncbi:ubiquitin 3 binding protein But2 C-terminal domain-containing protein [Nemania abortiva]|nr:ubiquitin 3 binding protein But2 C-terminal domain-containing protein [Nemania abortiva]
MLIPFLSVFWLHSVRPVDAQVTRANVGCGFHLSCSGAFNGSIGEKSSGQARASSNVVPSLFTWFGDAFADEHGSGCWWTPPTFTLQCDQNQPPDHGFQIGCDGALSFSGQTVFYECPTGEGDEVNIYLQPISDQCHEITIQADSCAPSTCPGGGVGPGGGGGAGPSPGVPSSPTLPSTLASSSTPGTAATSLPSTSQGPPTPSPFTTGGGGTSTTSITSTSTVTTTQPAPTASGCVEASPDKITLIDQGNPGTSYGPNDAGFIQVSPNASTIFNFGFSDADVGKTCELSFRIGHGQPFNLTGTGIVTFASLDDWANANTTYGSMPRIIETMANEVLYGGAEYRFGPFPCPGSTTRSAVFLTEAPMADTCLDCEQGDGTGMFLWKC